MVLSRVGRLRSWWSDGSLSQLFQNAGILVSGNVGASLLGLISMGFAARALGLELLGVFVLIRAYVTVVDNLVNVQSWTAMIRYGAMALEQKDAGMFKSLIKFGTLLDLGSAALGSLVGVLMALWIGQWQGWSDQVVGLTMLYSLVIAFHLSGTPKAILRLFRKFHLLAMTEVAGAVLKMTGVIVVFLAGGGLEAFLAVWMMTEIFGYVLLLALGWRELRRHGYRAVLRSPLRGIGARCKGLWGFVWATHMNRSLRLSSKEFDTLLVGGVLGVGAAGLYKVAKQCAKVTTRISDPLRQVIYPELARLWARRDFSNFKQLILRSGLAAGCVVVPAWLVLAAFGQHLLHFGFGPEFVEAHPLLVWYMLALTINVFGFPLGPAISAMGHPEVNLWIRIASTLFYLPMLYVLLTQVGLVGAGIAYLLYILVLLSSMAGCEWRLLRRRVVAYAS